MLSKNTSVIKDEETRQMADFILGQGLGNAIELEAVPTATAPLLEDNEWGTYSSIVYFRVSNTIYVITPSSTIPIT